MFRLLRKLVGNQYLEVVRIIVPPEILVPPDISAQFERNCLFQLNNFTDLIHKKDFDIYEPVAICNFPKKLEEKKYIRLGF